MADPSPRPDDLAAVRAEGRRLLAAKKASNWFEDNPYGTSAAWTGFINTHADALLADPAPEGLSEDEREFVRMARPLPDEQNWIIVGLLAIIDRLSGSTSTGGPSDG